MPLEISDFYVTLNVDTLDYFRGRSIGVYQNFYLPAFYADSKINIFQISIKSGQIKIWTNPYVMTSKTVYFISLSCEIKIENF